MPYKYIAVGLFALIAWFREKSQHQLLQQIAQETSQIVTAGFSETMAMLKNRLIIYSGLAVVQDDAESEILSRQRSSLSVFFNTRFCG